MRSVCLVCLLAFIFVCPAIAGSDIILPSGISVSPGQQIAFPVTLAQPAPSGGVFITLSSSDLSKVTVSPTAILITQDATTGRPVQLTGVGVGTASITAVAFNMMASTQTVLVGTAAAGSLSFSTQSITMSAGGTQNVTLSLSSATAAGGVVVDLSSDNPSVAQAQPTATISAQSTSTQTSIVAVGPGTTVIHAHSLPNYADTTLTVTVAGPGTISLPAGITVAPSQSAAFPVTLSTPAPAGGLTVTMASNDSSKVLVSPTSISVAGGSTSPAIQPQVTGMASGSAVITASASGYTSANQTVQSQAAQVTATLTFTPPSLTLPGAGPSSLQLNLSTPAPASGLTVNLTSSNSASVTVPAAVKFAANSISVSVPITGVAAGSATITASASNAAGTSANVTVMGSSKDIILPSGLVLSPGQQVKIQLMLAKPAVSGGVFVSLSTSDSSKVALTPANIFIPEGTTTSTRQPQLTGIDFGSATITASAAGMIGDTQAVLVGSALSLSPGSLTITGTGATQNLTLNLPSPAPAAGLTFTLSSSNPVVATVPATIMVAGNTSSSTVPVTSVSPGMTVIHASALPSYGDTTASVAVVSAGAVVLPAGVTVTMGQSAAFPIAIGTAAPAGGLIVTLSSSDPSKVTVSPASVSIAAGSTTPAAQPLVTGLTAGAVTISGSAPGYTPASQTVQSQTLPVTSTLSFAPNSLILSSTGTTYLQLNLSIPPPAGLTVNLTSNNPGAIAVTPTVTFTPNSSSVSVPVTGLTPGSATITASAANATGATASVVFTAPTPVSSSDIVLPSGLSVQPGQQLSFALSLSKAAPAGGVFITLSSSDATKMTVAPVNVFIPEGLSIPSRQPILTGVNSGSATLIASALGLNGDSKVVQVGSGGPPGGGSGGGGTATTLTFSPASVTISSVGSTQTVTLNLSAPASSNGLTVTLSSDNPGVATLSSTVTFAANTSAVNVQVTGAGAGATVIHAIATGFPDTTATVTVAGSSSSIILPAGITVSIGGVITFPVSLAKPAPAGGVTVTLTSSNPNVVPILPDTMFIAEGATVPAVQALVGALIPGSAIITATAPGFGTATQGVQAVTPAISVTWYGACWATATIYGYAGNYQAMDFAMTVSNPAPIQGTLYFNATCDPAGGSDNMNDYGLVYGSVHKVQGFSHHPDEIPTSALYWIGPRTTDGRCAPGSPCSGCVVYNKNTPNCSDMP